MKSTRAAAVQVSPQRATQAQPTQLGGQSASSSEQRLTTPTPSPSHTPVLPANVMSQELQFILRQRAKSTVGGECGAEAR